MHKIKETFTLNLTYEMTIDSESGEILESKLINKTIDKSVKTKKQDNIVDKDEKPMLYLEDTKYRLNTSAINLMGIEAGDKLEISYEETSNGTFPIIYKCYTGNKVTKTFTVACRGRNNEQLSIYGKEFLIVAHPSKENVFQLSCKNVSKGDSNISIESQNDVDLTEFLDNSEDVQITEIDSNFFKL